MNTEEAEMTQEKAYFFRPYEPSDINFIHSSWGRSYYKGANYIRSMSPTEFNEHHRPIRDKLLASKKSIIIVCASKMDPSLIIGWVMIEPRDTIGKIVHYLYVKEAFKREGIGAELLSLLKEDQVIISHLTDKAERILNHSNRYKHYRFLPHLI